MNHIDLPRFTSAFMLVIGTFCLVGIFTGGAFFELPDEQAGMLKDVCIWCYGFATSGKFLNLVGSGIKGKGEGK